MAQVRHWRHRTRTAVAQVKTFTIDSASTLTTAVWTLTLTLDNGDTHTVTYTEDGSPTTTEIATGLYNAVVASTNPYFAALTATNPSAGVFVLTASTAGVPFTASLADSSDGTHTETATTANVGDNDYSLTGNWEDDAIPTTNDDVVLGAGTVAMKYGLNQTSAAIDEFNIEPGHNADVGMFQQGIAQYLRIDPNSLTIEGKGALTMLDIGSANINVFVRSEAPSRADGRRAIYLKGSNIATLEIVKGDLGIAVLEQETATVATLLIGYDAIPTSDSKVYVGSGVTLTTLTQQAGICVLGCAATTVTVSENATLHTEGAGAITTANVYGTAHLKSSGTITTLNVWGTADFSRDRTARTITNVNGKAGGKLIIHSGITLTNDVVAPATPGSFTVEYVE